MDLELSLRATSDTLVQALEQLADLEAEKRTLEPGHPRLVELVNLIEGLAEQVTGLSVEQRQMTEVGNALVESGSPVAPERSIDDTVRPLHLVLTEWRAAERELAAATLGSQEQLLLDARCQALRVEYRRGFELQARDDPPHSN